MADESAAEDRVEAIRRKIGEGAMDSMDAMSEEVIEAIEAFGPVLRTAVAAMEAAGMERALIVGILTNAAIQVVYE